MPPLEARHSTLRPQEYAKSNRTVTVTFTWFQIVASHVSEMVNLQSRESLHGLAERVVGVESLIFLGSQFEYIQQYVLHLVPDEKRHFIDQFYSQVGIIIISSRRNGPTDRSFPATKIITLVRWSVRVCYSYTYRYYRYYTCLSKMQLCRKSQRMVGPITPLAHEKISFVTKAACTYQRATVVEQGSVLILRDDYFLKFILLFFQTVACVSDLRRSAYMCVSAHAVDMQLTVKEMGRVNFNAEEITSQHSPYIDRIVRVSSFVFALFL